jgi:hypothetical protein
MCCACRSLGRAPFPTHSTMRPPDWGLALRPASFCAILAPALTGTHSSHILTSMCTTTNGQGFVAHPRTRRHVPCKIGYGPDSLVHLTLSVSSPVSRCPEPVRALLCLGAYALCLVNRSSSMCPHHGHVSLPRKQGDPEQQPEPRICPKCKSAYWNRPRRTQRERGQGHE